MPLLPDWDLILVHRQRLLCIFFFKLWNPFFPVTSYPEPSNRKAVKMVEMREGSLRTLLWSSSQLNFRPHLLPQPHPGVPRARWKGAFWELWHRSSQAGSRGGRGRPGRQKSWPANLFCAWTLEVSYFCLWRVNNGPSDQNESWHRPVNISSIQSL